MHLDLTIILIIERKTKRHNKRKEEEMATAAVQNETPRKIYFAGREDREAQVW